MELEKIYEVLVWPLVATLIIGVVQFYKTVIRDKPINDLKIKRLEEQVAKKEQELADVKDKFWSFRDSANESIGELKNQITAMKEDLGEIKTVYREEMNEFRKSLENTNIALAKLTSGIETLKSVLERELKR